MSNKPILDGIRILDLTRVMSGPYCTSMLADLGAEIIKIEMPETGDEARHFGPYKDGESTYFMMLNRAKKSVTINMKDPEGLAVVKNLIPKCDAIVENFRPGVMDRLGLSLDVLRERNPRLIYCAITGFGSDGPYEKRPAYDAVAQSVSGVASLFVDPDDPVLTGPTIADNLTGINACYGIMAALLERERGGPPRRIDVNMLESTIWFIPDPFANMDRAGIEPGPLMRVTASQSYAMKCADGKLLAVHLSSPEKFWQGVTAALEREDLRTDPRFAERMSRIENYLALSEEFKKTAITQPRAHWMPRLEENDVPFAPINTLPEVFEDPQVRHLGTFTETEHPEEGAFKYARRAVYFDGARDDQRTLPPPQLGEHTDEVLAEIGYDAGAIAALRDRKIV